LSQGQGETLFGHIHAITYNERLAVMSQGLIVTFFLVSCSCLDVTGLTTQSYDSSEDNNSETWLTASKQSSDRTVPDSLGPDIDDEGPGTSIEYQEYFDLPDPNLTDETRASTRTAKLLTPSRNLRLQKIVSKRKSFVVLTMPRSASTTFCERLRDEEGFGCSGELLWHGRSHLKYIVQHWRMKCSIWPLDTCDQGCLTSALDKYWSTCKNRRCGFKVFPEHLESCTSGPQYFRDIGVSKVIILERRNKTAQYESLAKAYATGDWGWGPGGKKDPEWRKEHPQEEFIRSMNQWYATLRELYNTSLHVYVEDYLTLPVQRRRVSYYLKSDITSPSPF
jgi:hypothetical protein